MKDYHHGSAQGTETGEKCLHFTGSYAKTQKPPTQNLFSPLSLSIPHDQRVEHLQNLDVKD